MKAAIIADDLTGANDSGVQFCNLGWKTTVLLRTEGQLPADCDVVVVDTDSRAAHREEAYRRVKQAADFISGHSFELIYKKIDSTMRGNIGAEIDAMFDRFRPDFVAIAPGYPLKGRKVVDGYHYVNGRLLHETEAASDPKTPVNESYLPRLLRAQTSRRIALVTRTAMAEGPEALRSRLKTFYDDNVPYLLFDSESDDDFKQMVAVVGACGYRVLWAGSAGLAGYLPIAAGTDLQERTEAELCAHAAPGAHAACVTAKDARAVLLVVGSLSSSTRDQMAWLLRKPDTDGIVLKPEQMLADEAFRLDCIERTCADALKSLRRGRHVVLYTPGGKEAVKQANELGATLGLDAVQVSTALSDALAQAACRILTDSEISGIVMTGGDTARKLCDRLAAESFELTGEVEPGVPMGILHAPGGKSLRAVTKAGGFGTEQVLRRAIDALQGRKTE